MPSTPDLRSNLSYNPEPLRFGTSGRRGEIRHLTQLEIYINALAELRYLQSLPVEQGGVKRGDEVFFAYDLRPSSTALDPLLGRGQIAQAVVQAIGDAGMLPVNLGEVPTPALTLYAISRGKGSVMITGSHIPFDRNGYKLNTSCGELSKELEKPINDAVDALRAELYRSPFASSQFDANGMLKLSPEFPKPVGAARDEYMRRYLDFFSDCSLQGWRILVYQHSAVGRDLLVDLLRQFGAEVIPDGRSDTFVPIDTENIGAAQLQTIEHLASKHGHLDAVVSTDGDSDRPLVLGVEEGGRLRFFGGDLLGMVVADYLGADAVVVPISCNDSIDRGKLASILEPKTRIGSPFVIAGMEAARTKGRSAVCGWEANGGFLLGSDIQRNGKTLRALPTRDAILPILCALFSAKQKGIALPALFQPISVRFSRAALLPDFPRASALRIIKALTPDPSAIEIGPDDANFEQLRRTLAAAFTSADGFGSVAKINYTDGVRLIFSNGEVAHVRPSGNADELRIYAVADSQERADEIASAGVRTPNGILLRLRDLVISNS